MLYAVVEMLFVYTVVDILFVYNAIDVSSISLCVLVHYLPVMTAWSDSCHSYFQWSVT